MIFKQLAEKVLKEGSPELINELLKLGCINTFNKKEVVEYLLENRKEDSIIMLLENKGIDVKYLEKYFDVIVDKKLTTLNALLLDKKNKSIKKGELKNLSINDTTPAALLKKTWGTKKLKDGSLQISSYKGVEVDVIVPSQIGKGKVTQIGPEAFSPDIFPVRLSEQQMEARRNLHSVVISEGIESIEESAFSSCRNLKEIKLPDSMCLIGRNAFSKCTRLEKVIIPKNVSHIEKSAFSMCSGLKTIIIPRNVSYIGYGVFRNTNYYWNNTPSDDLTIYGEKGSYAEQYALENGIKFEVMLVE